ncbi:MULTISPECIES: enoyl-CoA hydratase/isomerase family protein [Dickeya]|uniref:CpmB protein involved in carbapenem biosynthesis n=1 Tax=Dickeya aquatica TaxID=1401087 RepID=A0A375AFS8_9GAMM|nr:MULTISPECIES: enoyl-CoA hydratase/isomerase family protein [Dickeya]SLM64940.1 CpmB protein involved in carbapenem biosynthesis [Dickeya aquatica]
MILEETRDNVKIITLNHPNKHNPFNQALENAVKAALKNANSDPEVNAIVVYGGKGCSFSAGGDFNEVKNLSGGADVERWIDRVIDLYEAVLHINKPTVAAVDGYAIGMGFQFALMFDYRIMANGARFVMPELKHGIGCSVGAAILTFTHGYNLMKDIIFKCQELDENFCLSHHIVNEKVEPHQLLERAFAQAKELAAYPYAALSKTKQSTNRSFLELLEKTRIESKEVHKAAFGARDAQKHFHHILGNKY